MGRRLTPDEMARLEKAFNAACDEAALTGATGRDVVRRIVLNHPGGALNEAEFKSLVREVIDQRRGLRLHRSKWM